MALTKCRECGREVSDQAAACPQCGAPVIGQAATVGEQAVLAGRQRSRLREATGNAVALLGIIVAIFGGGMAGSWMVGFVIAVVGIGFGAWLSYRA